MDLEQLISEALCLPISAIDYHVGQHLKKFFPGKIFIEGADTLFNIEEYAHAGQCKLELKTVVDNQNITFWRGPETGIMDWNRNVMWLSSRAPRAPSQWVEREAQHFAKNAWFEVEWQGAKLDVIVMHWYLDGIQTAYHFWILADSKEIAESFLVAVCA